MEFWEFLIQKEGDRSWLPLESPSVEILEGRYRVVARSNRASTATEIRVTHYATHETPPVRRVRKRSTQTNPDGLIVIMPFTRLQPGVWELRCTGDVMAEMMGESWQYIVQLDVVSETASASDDADDWEPDWQGNITAAEGIATEDRLAENTTEATEFERPLVVPAELFGAPERSEVESDLTADFAAVEPERAASELVAPEPDVNPELNPEMIAERSPAESSPEELANADASAESRPSLNVLEMLQQIEQRSEQLVDAAFRELGDLGMTDAAGSITDTSLAEAESGQASPGLQVILERETFIIQRGESLVLTGRVECPSASLAERPPVVSELRVRLYDPQTSQRLMDEVYPIDNRTPPFPFSGTISLPEHYQTYLVLGELIFQGHSPAGTSAVLATHSFNVTTDLHELIESVANDFPDVEALPSESLMPEVAEPVPAAELNRLAQSSTFQRSPQQPLPPQLRPPNPTRTHAMLDLPSFTAVSVAESKDAEDLEAADLTEADATETGVTETGVTAAETIAPSGQDDQAVTEADPVGLELEGVSTSAVDLLPEPAARPSDTQTASNSDQPDRPELSSAEAASEPSDWTDAVNNVEHGGDSAAEQDQANLFVEWDDLGNRVPIWQQRQQRPADLSNAPEDVSFRALNLQSRFWTRLQALATNPDLSATLNLSGSAGSSVGQSGKTVAQTQTTELARQGRSIGLDAELAAQEIVVDDDFAGVAPNLADAAPEEMELPPGSIMPEDEPIPMPRLQLPSGELTAGQPISITIKMPSLLARVYVKLWLRDRQTRSLVGTPRWIIDFVPDGFGNQMARTDVVVPPGCLKVQFEAIAVEIATQRESDKVTMTRPIVPPDLSPLSLDGLEI